MSEDKELKIEFAPGVKESIDKMIAEDPKLGEAFGDMLAAMHQAHAAVESGQYKSFDEAMFAITGQRPERVELDD